MGVLQRELLFPYYTRKCKAEDLMITFYTRVQDVIHLEHTTITHNAHTYVWTDHAPHSAKENKWRRKKIAPLLLWCTIFFSLLFSSESVEGTIRWDCVWMCVACLRANYARYERIFPPHTNHIGKMDELTPAEFQENLMLFRKSKRTDACEVSRHRRQNKYRCYLRHLRISSFA